MAQITNQDDFMKTALRLPRDLHAQVQEAAKANGRSMNAEIVARLQDSFEQGASSLTTEDITKLFDAHHERLLATLQEAVARAKAPPPPTEK